VLEEIDRGVYCVTCDICGRRRYIDGCGSWYDAFWEASKMGWTYEQDDDLSILVCPECEIRHYVLRGE